LAVTPTPPVRKKLNSSLGNRSSLPMMRQSRRNEKRSLSRSNSERHTFWYSAYVKWSLIVRRRAERASEASSGAAPPVSPSDPSLLAWMLFTKRAMNQLREYWYMGSMFARSRMVKKRTELNAPHGVYPSRAASISTCVASAIFCFSPISSETIFASDSTPTALASARMSPSVELRVCRMRSSISLSRRLLSALVTTSSWRSASSSGSSSATTTPRSWSLSPSTVIMKLSSVTFTAVSGR
jgi:hypothetical protein